MEGVGNKTNSSITSSVNILLHSVIKLRLYCFENATSCGENLLIVPLILNIFFVICRLISSRGKKLIEIVNRIFCEEIWDFFICPYRPALLLGVRQCSLIWIVFHYINIDTYSSLTLPQIEFNCSLFFVRCQGC